MVPPTMGWALPIDHWFRKCLIDGSHEDLSWTEAPSSVDSTFCQANTLNQPVNHVLTSQSHLRLNAIFSSSWPTQNSHNGIFVKFSLILFCLVSFYFSCCLFVYYSFWFCDLWVLCVWGSLIFLSGVLIFNIYLLFCKERK